MSKQSFIDFLSTTFRHLAAYSADGSIHDICMDWRHVEEMMAAGNSAYSKLKNICVWAKKNAGMGSFYRSRHELIFIWKSGTAPHINNFELGQHGRSRTNVWEYPGITSSGPARLEELSMHPTVKPVALVADAIKDCSKRGGIVLDPFLGSGTTVIAAERTGRVDVASKLTRSMSMWRSSVGSNTPAKPPLWSRPGKHLKRSRKLGSARTLCLWRKAKGSCHSCGRLRDVQFQTLKIRMTKSARTNQRPEPRRAASTTTRSAIAGRRSNTSSSAASREILVAAGVSQ